MMQPTSPMQVQGNEGASTSTLPPLFSPTSPYTRSASPWAPEDDEQRTLHGDSLQGHNNYLPVDSQASHLARLKCAERGILRDPFASADTRHPLTGQNVAFLDLPAGVKARSHRSMTEGAQISPLQFNKRPTFTSARSSVSCSSCNCSSTFSPGSGDEAARTRGNRTPSLSRSETEYSEGGVSTASHSQCPHALSHGGVSLLTAAMLAGEVSPRKQMKTACGILRREAQDTPVFETDCESAAGATNKQATRSRPRFVEPPKPTRSRSQHKSPSPPPTHTRASLPRRSESSPSSPQAKRSPSFLAPSLPLSEPSVPEQDPSRPAADGRPQLAPRRRLTFQDAEGVEQRIKARSDAAKAISGRSSETTSSADGSIASRPCSSGQSSPISTPATLSDATGNASTDRAVKLSSTASGGDMVLVASPSHEEGHKVQARESRLKFAPSPHELVGLRRSSTIRGRCAAGSPPGDVLGPVSDDDAQPYVDGHAASSSCNTQRTVRNLATKKPQRSLSPAPRHLGGSEHHRGSGRARSPAPRGKVAMPRSIDSDDSEEVDPDTLGYDEDDEDDSDDIESDELDSEDGDDSAGSALDHGLPDSRAVDLHAGRVRSGRIGQAHCDSHLATNRRDGESLSPDEQTVADPAAVPDFEFEDEGEDVARSRTSSGTGSPYRSPFASTAGSPLPFARSRVSSTAVSDAETPWPQRRQHPHSHSISAISSSMSNRPKRPSISPIRSKSSAVIMSLDPVDPRSDLSLPASFSRSLQRDVSPCTSRSYSAAAPRCAPSLLESTDQALGQPSSPPAPSQSPDAWTALRSCLISAMGEGEAASGLGLGGRAGHQPQRSWLSAFSTPGSQDNSRSRAPSLSLLDVASASQSNAEPVVGGAASGGILPERHYSTGILEAARPAPASSLRSPPLPSSSGVGPEQELLLLRGRSAASVTFTTPSSAEHDRSSRRTDSPTQQQHPPPPRPIRIASESGLPSNLSREDALLSGANRLRRPKRRPFKSRSPPSTLARNAARETEGGGGGGGGNRRRRSLDPTLIAPAPAPAPALVGLGRADSHAHAAEGAEKCEERKIRRRTPSQMSFGWGRPE